MIPTPIAGVKPWMGNRKPVTLVSTVVNRNSAVVTGSRLEANIPPTATSPLPIEISVIDHMQKRESRIDIPRIILRVPEPQRSRSRMLT